MQQTNKYNNRLTEHIHVDYMITSSRFRTMCCKASYSKIQAPAPPEWVLTPDSLGSSTGSRVPCALQKSRGAQLVSLRRGAGEQAVPGGAGEGCQGQQQVEQGQQQVEQGLLKFYSVSDLLHLRIKIVRPAIGLGAKFINIVDKVRSAVSSSDVLTLASWDCPS